MTEQGLRKVNKWATVATLAVALIYGSYTVWTLWPFDTQCCDGPCLNTNE